MRAVVGFAYPIAAPHEAHFFANSATCLEKCGVAEFLPLDILTEIKDKYPEYVVGYVIFKNLGNITSSALKRIPADFFVFEESIINKRLVNACHRADKPVYVWTVNDPSQMAVMKSINVDGIITDYPDIAHDTFFSAVMPRR